MKHVTGTVFLVGTGFVADLYMRSLKAFPGVTVGGAFDIDSARLETFCSYWQVKAFQSLEALLAEKPENPALILNLTNPHAHFDVSKAALEAGHHVYSEKPLAVEMADALKLADIAEAKGLNLGSAPCSWMSDTAQTVRKAIQDDEIGVPRLVYAELDDDFVPQAPYRKWANESGAPWPAEDEFHVGCTLEHAGYYLTWLMAVFGPVKSVTAASAGILPDKPTGGKPAAPDFSTGTLFFEAGMVARLTCSIVARHDHELRIFGDKGILEVDECWDNRARVRIRNRFTVRRRLVNSPFPKSLKWRGSKQPTAERFGAASMNFALGPAELLASITANKSPALSRDFSLHVNEVTLALQNAGSDTGAVQMTTRFNPLPMIDWS